jgi:hypothetical protein
MHNQPPQALKIYILPSDAKSIDAQKERIGLKISALSTPQLGFFYLEF